MHYKNRVHEISNYNNRSRGVGGLWGVSLGRWPVDSCPRKCNTKRIVSLCQGSKGRVDCKDKKIVGLNLEGKKLTPKLITNLVKFEEMEFLILDSTNITDKGLK